MQSGPLIVAFLHASAAEGNRLASSLQDCLRDTDPDITVTREREQPDTQDFGASLALILGSASVTAIAKGIATWLARNSGAQIEIRRNGELVLRATHLESPDIARIAEALSRNR
jgi:hypothetical protein